jgi:2-polyprenyl-3-methyl-5-hydroxy-6-metoxy-1,4-benzoquinol methylase
MVRPDGSRAGIRDGPGVSVAGSLRSARIEGQAFGEPDGAMMEQDKNVSQRWVEELREEGYEYHVSEPKDCRQLELSRVWKRIFKATQLSTSEKLRVLEVGCGGGIQLAKLAALGCECIGIDVSKEVLARAENYFSEIHGVCGQELDIKLLAGDFYDLDRTELGGSFDLVFNFGVIEHILDDSARLRFLKKKYELTKDGGHIISYVPNGSHPLRNKMKQMKLGGYNIPEIDYNQHLMEEEFKAIGAKQIIILPHNLFIYLLMEKKNLCIDWLKKLIYLGMQVVPWAFLPQDYGYRHAGSLIGIGRK